MRAVVEPRPAARSGDWMTSGGTRLTEQVEPELQRILAGGVRQLVDERLERERQRVALGRTQRARRHAERHDREAEVEVRHERRRELRAARDPPSSPGLPSAPNVTK